MLQSYTRNPCTSRSSHQLPFLPAISGLLEELGSAQKLAWGTSELCSEAGVSRKRGPKSAGRAHWGPLPLTCLFAHRHI